MDDKKAVEPNEDWYIIKTNREGEIKLAVNRENNIKLYKMLKDKLDNKIYSGMSPFKTFRKNIENGEETFMSLSIIDQSKVLLQILKFLKCNADLADITLIGGSAHSGSIKGNKDITDVDFRIIDLSPAGLTERIRRV